MSSTTPQTRDLAAHTFGHNHFSPPPLPERLERAPQMAAADSAQEVQAMAQDLDQRIRDVGEW